MEEKKVRPLLRFTSTRLSLPDSVTLDRHEVTSTASRPEGCRGCHRGDSLPGAELSGVGRAARAGDAAKT